VALWMSPPAASMALATVAISKWVTPFAANSAQVPSLQGMPDQRGTQPGDARRAASATRVLQAARGQA
jgi:hypothetical protein